MQVDALRGSGKDDNFIDKLLEIIEGISMQMLWLKETVEEMKELEGEYVNAINELMLHISTRKLQNGMMWCDINSI